MFFQKGADLIVRFPRQPRIELLGRLIPFLFVADFIVSPRAAQRRFFFLCHNALSFRHGADDRADTVHNKRACRHDAYEQYFQQPFPEPQNRSHVNTSA